MRFLVAAALAIAGCCCFIDIAEARAQRFHEKTRFDRSVDNEYYQDTNTHVVVYKKPRIFTDTATHYTAYRDGALSVCYLDKLKGNEADDTRLWREVIRNNKHTIFASDRSLTKIEAWRLAGGRIVEFCHGMTFILLQNTKPTSETADDPFYNELPEDENDIVQKRVADVVLRPLKVRAKRQTIMEERERLNQQEFARRKREAGPYRGAGRFRGQTQSQYLNVGNDGQKEGKAEAEATQHASRAVVSY
ncbi:venom protein F precursor [Nasonia vitripennis]|uniref:Uncharacterized protein n=1 Tax=Nasonia vitripennis TaxID=7425 RepID=A0A7M6UV47_NASVI|nr:venom protein F precursor [Nasonia vitripennis]